jgi:hypothetical protein
MPSKKQERMMWMRRYKDETGQASIDMKELAKYMMGKGWPMPEPKTPLERLAEQLSDDAREEMRRDSKTGRPYRANLAVTVRQGRGQQMTLWTDIDEAPRHIAQKAFVQRREQMIGDGLQLTFDVTHWNSVNPQDVAIEMPMDFTDDIQWRLNAPGDDEAAA